MKTNIVDKRTTGNTETIRYVDLFDVMNIVIRVEKYLNKMSSSRSIFATSRFYCYIEFEMKSKICVYIFVSECNTIPPIECVLCIFFLPY